MRALVPPKLDDRTFDQLRADAITRLRTACPGWTDFSPSDPGIALVEVFAFLTEVMLYRINRVPDKQYAAFLGLLGTARQPPAAATTGLRFTRGSPGETEIVIPQGTRASAAGGITFTTASRAVIPRGASEVRDVLAFHGEQVEGELVGVATGAPGLEVSVRRPPIVASMMDQLDLVVGVEVRADELPDDARAVELAGKTFQVWREVETFAGLGEADTAFRVDRARGVIRFPPAVRIRDESGVLRMGESPLGAVPRVGREIRVSYRTGGGSSGNVAAGSVTQLRDASAPVKVDNPNPAAGGRDAESLENAMLRGPTEFHRLHRAVVARDYESIARQAAGIARAKALTKADHWRYARPGVVEVLLVPEPGAGVDPAGPVTAEQLVSWAAEAERAKVAAALERTQPLGVSTEVRWTRFKPVSVKLRAVTARQEDEAEVERRVLQRLHRLINPLPEGGDEGWLYGRTLRRYEVEGAVRAEPGVLYVSQTELLPARLPDDRISALAIDGFQPRTWYAASGQAVFRSLNAGDGWELLVEFPGEAVRAVRSSPFYPGLQVAVTTVEGAEGGSRIYVSADCGESWTPIGSAAFSIQDAAWLSRDGRPLLLLASDKGLHELVPDGKAAPVAVEVDAGAPGRGFWSVAVNPDPRGIPVVALTAYELGGVYLSRLGGVSKSFTQITGPAMQGKDVRALGILKEGGRTFLWAGLTVRGAEPETEGGCYRYELLAQPPAQGWEAFASGWNGRTCYAIAGTRSGLVLAATNSRGVLWLDPSAAAPAWVTPPLDSGLPLRQGGPDEAIPGRILRAIPALAVDVTTPDAALDRIVVGTERGVYRGSDPQAPYEALTDPAHFGPELRERITLPPTWLFTSAEHRVEVVSEDRARGADAHG